MAQENVHNVCKLSRTSWKIIRLLNKNGNKNSVLSVADDTTENLKPNSNTCLCIHRTQVLTHLDRLHRQITSEILFLLHYPQIIPKTGKKKTDSLELPTGLGTLSLVDRKVID